MKLKINRVFLAGICVLCALILCFAVTPLFNRELQHQTEIIRVTAHVAKGSVLSADKIEKITVGGYNLPEEVVTAEADCLGKYLTGDVVPGDYLLPAKLSDSPLLGNEYLLTLEEKLAFSVTLKSFAAGLSAKLEPMDIVTVFYTDNNSNDVVEVAALPPELQYVKVLAVTNADAVDIDTIHTTSDSSATDGEDANVLPATVTLLVTPRQAQLLAAIESKGKIQLALTCRGAKEDVRAKELLLLQEQILTEAMPSESEGADTLNNASSQSAEEAPASQQEAEGFVEGEDE